MQIDAVISIDHLLAYCLSYLKKKKKSYLKDKIRILLNIFDLFGVAQWLGHQEERALACDGGA